MSEKVKGASLLLLVSILMVVGALLVRAGLHDIPSPSPWKPLGLILGSFWVGWLVTSFKSKCGDVMLLPLVSGLCAVSWLELYRIGPAINQPNIGNLQARWIVIGMICFVFTVYFLRDYRLLEDYKYSFLFGGVFLQIAVMVFGVEVNGATLWFEIGSMRFQPIELVKIFIVIFLAAYLRQFRHWIRLGLVSKEGRLPRKALIILGLGMAVAEGVLVAQKDLGMALLLFGLFLSMFYVATGRKDLISLACLLSAFCAYNCYKIFGHVRVRVQAWLDPFQDPAESGYQMCQALFSIANGGLDGSGLAMGLPFFVPESHTDFIFVAIAEEFGLLGAVAVLLMLMVFVARCFHISMRVSDEFGTLLSAAFASLYAWQSLIIILGTTKMAPMTGITLPFMSYGGSSLLSNFAILALLWQISAFSISEEEANSEPLEARHGC